MTENPEIRYIGIYVGSLYQCDHHARGRPCTTRRKCGPERRIVATLANEKPTVERRDPGTIRGWGDGTTGPIVIGHNEFWSRNGPRFRDAARALAWAEACATRDDYAPTLSADDITYSPAATDALHPEA